jgi:hypothetical protein
MSLWLAGELRTVHFGTGERTAVRAYTLMLNPG